MQRSTLLALTLSTLLALAACAPQQGAVAPTQPAAAPPSTAEAAPPSQATQPTEAPQPATAPTEPTATPSGPAIPQMQPKGGIRKSSSNYKGKLSLWVLGYTPGNQFATPFDLAVAQFEADNPDIDVEIIGYPPNDEGFTKLTTALQTGQGIDVLRLPSDRLPAFVEDDLIAPIDEYLTEADKADYFPSTLEAVRLKDGKAYAWPLWVVPMGMYLNLDVFKEANVPLPSKDWTWDEFVETAKKLTFKRANGEQVYGFAGFIDAGVINTWGLWMNEDPSVRPVVNGKFGFNNEKTAAALKRFAELALVHKVTPPDFGALKDADVKGGFKSGQYAMVVDATGFSPQLKKDGINFAIYPLPSYNGNRLTVGAIGLIAVAATNDKEKERAAMDLARYLTSAEVQEDVPPSETAATGFYLAPAARRSVKVAPPLDEFVPMLDYMWITPLTPAWPKLTRLFHTEYQNIIFGKADPAEAMARIAPEADALLAQP